MLQASPNVNPIRTNTNTMTLKTTNIPPAAASTRTSAVNTSLQVNGATSVLSGIATLIAGSGLPFADGTVTLIKLVITAFEEFQENDENFRQLSAKLNYMVGFMMEVHKQDLESNQKKTHMQTTLQNTEEEIVDLFHEAQNFLQIYQNQSSFFKLLASSSNKSNFNKICEHIDKLLQRFSLEKIISRLPISEPPKQSYMEQSSIAEELSRLTGLDYNRDPRRVLEILNTKVEKNEVSTQFMIELLGEDWALVIANMEKEVRFKASDQGILLNIPLPMYEYWIQTHGDLQTVQWRVFYENLVEKEEVTVSELVLKTYFDNQKINQGYYLDLSDYSRFAHKCVRWGRVKNPNFDITRLTMALCLEILEENYDRSIDENAKFDSLLEALQLDQKMVKVFCNGADSDLRGDYDEDTQEWLDKLWKEKNENWRNNKPKTKKWLQARLSELLSTTRKPREDEFKTNYVWIVGGLDRLLYIHIYMNIQ
jgi:hypothetical protein